MSSSENLSPPVLMKLMREIKSLTSNPPDGITLVLNDENISQIGADMVGPAGTPFEGGRFKVQLYLPNDYPASPPKANFLTKLFHPNVSSSGEICVNTLKKDWQPTHGLRHVLLVIHCLLIHPNPESALNEEAGKLLMEDYAEYEKRVRLMTRIHAQAKKSQDNQALEQAVSSPRHINANNCDPSTLTSNQANLLDKTSNSLTNPTSTVTKAKPVAAPKPAVKKSLKRL